MTTLPPPPIGPAKHEALARRSAGSGYPVVEYSEKVTAPFLLLLQLDLEAQKAEGWLPLALQAGRATVLTCRTPDAALTERVKGVLAAAEVDYLLTLEADFIRVVEHNQDLNPGFPPQAGRTPLARVRTYLAGRRSLFAHYRTLMAKSRTGLASIRTALSFITIALLLVRIVGTGYLLFLELPLLLTGVGIGIDSLRHYLPARRINRRLPSCRGTLPTGGSTVLAADHVEESPRFSRSAEVPGSTALRAGWGLLSPVMRRRFLASDRTDLAEERTTLACLRTRMAKARTGLAFVRTGAACLGLGLGLLRAFPSGSWLVYDLGLVAMGGVMMLEGLFWYGKGRSSGHEGLAAVRRHDTTTTIWDLFFPHPHTLDPTGATLHPKTVNLAAVSDDAASDGRVPQMRESGLRAIASLCEQAADKADAVSCHRLPVKSSHAPGIWATTGLALERTVLAERRNVMARLRTIMARSRTGLAFIRTGLTILLTGLVFLVYFPRDGWAWGLFDATLILAGLVAIIDGLYWTIPAERQRRELPYCFADMEIVLPDYGRPARAWPKAVFSHDPS